MKFITLITLFCCISLFLGKTIDTLEIDVSEYSTIEFEAQLDQDLSHFILTVIDFKSDELNYTQKEKTQFLDNFKNHYKFYFIPILEGRGPPTIC